VSRPPGREQYELARDSWSYLHFPMIAGIVLVALGMKTTIAHVGDPLDTVPAAALVGGVSLYLLAHVAFRLRNMRTLNVQRLLVAMALLVLIPVAGELDAVVTAGIVAVVLWCLIAFEVHHYAAARDHLRHKRAQ
jgi:low temperature requirement protein LtrA